MNPIITDKSFLLKKLTNRLQTHLFQWVDAHQNHLTA